MSAGAVQLASQVMESAEPALVLGGREASNFLLARHPDLRILCTSGFTSREATTARA